MISCVLYREVRYPFLGVIQQLVQPSSMKPHVLNSLHESMGHHGVDRTNKLLQLRVYWPRKHRETKDCVSNVERCLVCSQPKDTTPVYV